MSFLFIKILFFALIPLGLFILVKGILLVTKSVNTKLLLEMPYKQQSGQFSIAKAGNYAIWQKSSGMLKRKPLDTLLPYIENASTKKELPIQKSQVTVRTNNFSSGRVMIYNFYAEVGNYIVALKPGKRGAQDAFLQFEWSEPDLNKYFLQIRESTPTLMVVLGIITIVAGAFIFIGGVILGLNAEQILRSF